MGTVVMSSPKSCCCDRSSGSNSEISPWTCIFVNNRDFMRSVFDLPGVKIPQAPKVLVEVTVTNDWGTLQESLGRLRQQNHANKHERFCLSQGQPSKK